ncbi:tetratricopeptide repeat protein [Alteromonas sp. McT4-15]|jgi:tetratricopeptide (TPR) repeat protein|uniref:tetratricopeptide repeat protein n=1 Tax=Alteromonas sp. McT4-15 TaxID=2881256 RepID=UPI001CF91139|nr:tetratricopeptide repeat protein [Alteromonas sp. McT4-15]MCB4437564.1 tetratricopeptide repeat protein [Alteromonas sp. McT4-15]
MNTRILIVVLCTLLVACQSTERKVTSASPTLLDDSLFPSYGLFPVETPEEIFYLDEEAQQFAERAVYESSASEKNVKRLVKSIFGRSEHGVLYRNSANTTANTTFSNRAANCLSLSIMAYALAEHAGLKATFYEVDIPEYWTRRDGFSLLNGHINLRVSVPNEPLLVSIGSSYADIDFDPQMIQSDFPRNAVPKERVLSMFYNNKGADALVANSYSRAYSYFRAAATLSPSLQQSWVNLGVLYRMVGAYEQAELAYKHALTINDSHLTAWENLAILYIHQERDEEAKAITEMVEARRRSNPYYHFILGEQDYDEGKYARAIEHYQRALRIDDSRHEILFSLARTYHQLGDINNAQRYLEKAVRHSPNEQDRSRYMSKIAALASR